ncbi:MAG: hypothetical protein IT532_14180 [Burkholderiales bacterium]|nr:hypothetical protein [Burkholderiales bacterium]
MTDRQYLALRRSTHPVQDPAPRAEGSQWRCRRSSDWVARTADVRREDVLMELLDDAHSRIRELEVALERCVARSL